MFGSILSATDPVAVVALLKELGAPETLTMCVTGEALLNDGMAIVLFGLFKAISLYYVFTDQKTQHPEKFSNIHPKEYLEAIGLDTEGLESGDIALPVAWYFIKVAFGGVVIGAFIGFIGVVWLSNATRKTGHADSVIQISITVSVAYLSYFVAEHIFGTSGVLATVAAALEMASLGWTHFVSPESMSHIWHFIENVGNTVIFLLAGVILGDYLGSLDERPSLIDSGVFWKLAVIYLSSMAIRFFMVFLLYPLLSKMGYGFTVSDCIVLSWGGLRGAVGLALAIDCDLSFHPSGLHSKGEPMEQTFGSAIVFHVGGMAILTLLINGISCGPLVQKLGLTTPDKYHELLIHGLDRIVADKCEQVFDKVVTDLDLDEAQQGCVRRSVGALNQGVSQRASRIPSENGYTSSARSTRVERAIRELFLSLLRAKYFELTESGLLLKDGAAAQILNTSIDAGKETVATHLSDFNYIHHACMRKAGSNLPPVLNMLHFVARSLPHFLHATDLIEMANMTFKDSTVCNLLLCFVQAHQHTQKHLQTYLEGAEVELADVAKVVKESQDEIIRAQEQLGTLDQEEVSQAKVDQAVNVVLQSETQIILKLHEHGALSEKDSHHLLEQVQADISASVLGTGTFAGGSSRSIQNRQSLYRPDQHQPSQTDQSREEPSVELRSANDDPLEGVSFQEMGNAPSLA